MHLLFKVVLKFFINVAALVLLTRFFSDFVMAEGVVALAIAAGVLTLLNVFVRPVLKLITFPLILLTFGLFNIVLYIVILYAADALTAELSIGSISTLIWSALILGILNSIF